MRSLQPWQRDAIRYVRLEIMTFDLQGECDKEWGEPCGYWSEGLRGLRMKILGVVSAPKNSSAMDKLLGGATPAVDIKDTEGRLMPWIYKGMKLMKNLEHVEVELVVPTWDPHKKLDWCNSLEHALNEVRTEGSKPIRMIYTERVE